ncbi:MAG: hypothetical protein F4010_07920, partial [Cenarchaeum sp. SB0669_bin_11]|nr:hypothetical protein [Cenarchaeum sp. SB0669_bin_11]
MDFDDLAKAERISRFIVVHEAEAAYAHAWGSADGHIDKHSPLLWMSTPGRHEVSLFECVSDLELVIAGFYSPANLKLLRAFARTFGGTKPYDEIKAACIATRRKIRELKANYPKRARRMMAAAFPEHRQAIGNLLAMNQADLRSGIRSLASAKHDELQAAKQQYDRMNECLTGSGLPPANTILRKD